MLGLVLGLAMVMVRGKVGLRLRVKFMAMISFRVRIRF